MQNRMADGGWRIMGKATALAGIAGRLLCSAVDWVRRAAWGLGVGLSVACAPGLAATYTLPGALPGGCSGSGTSYTCPSLALAWGDVLKVVNANTTLTVTGAFTPNGNELNWSSPASGFQLNVASMSGSQTFKLNGALTVTGSGAVTIGSSAQISGSLTASGDITTQWAAAISGAVSGRSLVSAGGGTFGGGITASAGVVTLGTSDTVTGNVTANGNSGNVTLGSSATVNGNVTAGGAVTLQSSASRVTGDVTATGNVTLGSGTTVSGNVDSSNGSVTLQSSDATVSRCIHVTKNSGAITLGWSANVGAVCCQPGNSGNCQSSCVANNSGDPMPPLCTATTTVTPFGFNCVESGANALAGHLYTKLAGTAFSADVVALKDSDGNGAADAVETSYASDQDRTVTVELVDGSGATACASRTVLNPAVSQNLTFAKANQPAEQGRKAVSLTVSKAYANLRCRVTDSALSRVGCSTDAFAVRPSSLAVASTANADATGVDPAATPTVKTGANFTLTATSNVTGYDGTPKIDATKVEAHSGAASTGAAAGSFPSANASTGVASGTAFTYGEAGYFRFKTAGVYDDTFTAVDSANGDCTADFSNAAVAGQFGCNFGNSAATSYFGRFIPDHFDVTVNADGALTAACSSGFTYTGQPMGYGTAPSLTIKPMNAAASGSVTQNYQGGFQKLTASGISFTAPTADAVKLGLDGATKTALSASLSAGALSNTSGTMTYTLSADDRYTYTRNANAQVGPYTASVWLAVATVSDGEVSAAGTLPTLKPTGVPLYYGRLQLDNAYGSELLDLPISLRALYWAGSGWQLNTADSCTSFAPSAIVLSGFTQNLSACETHFSPAAVKLSSGRSASLRLTRPGAGNGGSVAMELNVGATPSGSTCVSAAASAATAANLPWFAATNPTARATFGVYKTPLIYRRENY